MIQALKHLGPDNVGPRVVKKLRLTLPQSTKDDLRTFVKRNPRTVPDWMQLPVSQITSDAK